MAQHRNEYIAPIPAPKTHIQKQNENEYSTRALRTWIGQICASNSRSEESQTLTEFKALGSSSSNGNGALPDPAGAEERE